MNDSKEKLHKLLVEQGLYTKGYAEFNEQFSLPEKQQKLYSLMKEQGLYTKSPDEFTTQFFNDAAIATTVDTEDVKKKDTTESPLEGGGLVQSDSEVTTESDAFVLPTVEVGSSKPTTESPSEWSEFYAEGINPEPQTVKNYSIPSLFPKDVNNITDNPDDYERLSGDEAFDKAKSMGLYKFQDKKKETLFDDGDLFERSLSNIDKDLMGRKDDFVAPKLNYQLSEYGFTVEETGGFGITVTASNDNTEFFKVHDYRDSRNLKEAERLKAFIKKNKINSNSVLEDTKSILDKKRKFLDEEEIKNTVREFNNEAKEFIAERNGFVKQYEAFTAESEKFNGYSATEIANDPKLKEEYTAFLSQQKEVQSKMKSVLKKEELIKSKGYTIDRAAGGFYDMQSSQGNWVGGIFNKLVKGAISNTGKTAMRASMSFKYGMAQLELPDEQRRENLSKLAEADGIKIPSGLDYNRTVEWLKEYDKKEESVYAWSPTAGGVVKTIQTSYPTYEALSGKDKNEFLVEMLYKGKMFRNPFSETAASVDTEMGLVDAVDEGARKLWMSDNTTEKWEQMKSEGFWGGAVLGLAESLPAMVGGSSPYGWAQRTAQMFSMTSEAVYEEMESNPNFDDITEKEKAMVAIPIGLAVGALETIGLRNVISQKGLLNGVIARAMSKSTAETTAKTFSEFVKNDVKSMIAKGALTITGAGLAEFETGLFQEIADIEIKKIYNGVKDKEMFDTPDTLTDYVIQVATAGAQEMVGGFILGAPSAVSMAMSKKGGLEELPTDMFEVIDLISKDDKYRAMYVSKMKQRIISGEITKEEADIELARVNKMVGVAPSLPSGLSSEQKKEAFILVEEKNTLESEIDGKDKSLTKAKRERISKIDERLEEMSLEVEDSQAASEYVAELDDTKEKDPDTYWSVTPVSEEDAQNGTLIDVDGGRGLVTQEGDIKGVFKKIGSKVKGVADKIIQKAIEAGGVKLDNFDGYLTKIYERNGFRVASRVPFNEKYAPEGWSEEKNGRPDVVSMVYDPKNELDIEVKTFESPNEANAYRDSFLPKTETQGQDTEILGTEEELSELSDVLSKEEDTQEVSEEVSEEASEEVVDRLNVNADFVLDSLAKILPNLKIVVHKSSSDYKKATGKDGRGYYSKKQGVIHINAPKANSRTVAHEAFHAIFLESIKTDKEASRAAFNLMRSIRKSIGNNSKLAKAIDEFAGNYEEWVKNEERLSELIGIMSDEYTKLTPLARSKIIEFFRSIAKKLGINLGEDWGANDQEVIDMMNAISEGFRTSEEIDSSVLSVIDKAKNSSNKNQGEQKNTETREQKDGKTKGNRVFNNGLPKVKNVADKYYERVFGGQRPKFEGIKKIDKDRAAKIAKSFEDSKLSIKDVEVKEAYEAMASEVIEQYSDFINAGYSVEINNSEPYKNSQEMIDDLRDNNRIKIFSTDSGFGDEAITDKQRKENPLLAKSKFTDVNGEPLLINDLFRAVHDFFGHAELGNGFGAIGEENAWNVHVRMFSPKAARAMTTETRAQNSYVNFSGINDEVFKKRDRARELRKQGKEAEAQKLVAEVYKEMSFAEQKLTLLPEEYSTPEGEVSDREQQSVEKEMSEDEKEAVDSEVADLESALEEAFNDSSDPQFQIGSSKTDESKKDKLVENDSSKSKATYPVVSMYEKFVDRLSKAFPNVEVVTDKAAFDTLLDKEYTRQLVTKDQVVYGAVLDGKLYLNPALENYNTPIHEFGHIWINVAKEANPELYQKGLELIEGSEYLESVLADKAYQKVAGQMKAEGATQEEIDAYMMEEALATAIGNKGESFVSAEVKKSFKNWMKSLFDAVKKLTGASKMSSEKIQSLGLDEFLQGVVVDLLSEESLFQEAEVTNLSNGLQLMTSPSSASISDVVSIGRNEGFSDASIREVLKKRGFSAREINEALEVRIDPNTTMPPEFSKVKSGVNDAIKLFSDVRSQLDAFSRPTTVDGNTTQPSMYDVRQKAMDLMKAHPIFKEQSSDVQMNLLSGFDKTLNTTANKNVTAEISRIRQSLRDRSIGVNDLRKAQRELKNFIRKNLPASSTYSQGQINRLIASVSNMTMDNVEAQHERVLSVVEQQIAKMKKAAIREIKTLVKAKAKTKGTSSGRRRSNGVTAKGQAFFSAMKNVLKATLSSEPEAMNHIVDVLNANEELLDKLWSQPSDEVVSKKDEALMMLQYANMVLGGVESKSLEEIQGILNELKNESSESLKEYKEKKAFKAAQRENVRNNFTEQILETNKSLFDEDGNLLDSNERASNKDAIRLLFKQMKYPQAISKWLKDFGFTTMANTIRSAKNQITHLGTLTNLVDRVGKGKKLFTEQIYNRLNRMEESYLVGKFDTERRTNDIAKAAGFKNGYKEVLRSLSTGFHELKVKRSDTGRWRTDTFSSNQLLRIHALSLNKEQRNKLKEQGIDDSVLSEIEALLDPKLITFANGMVEFLSNEYFEGVNNIYSKTNEVNLGYVENYFPTMTVQTKVNSKLLEDGDFNGIFNAETSPALKERTDMSSDINLKQGDFTTVLDSHVDSMERYKAYAEGTKDINDIFKIPAVDALIDELGIKGVMKKLINGSVNPYAAMSGTEQNKVIDGLQRKFTGFALAFKAIQILKQSTSFVNAYSEYSFFPENSRVPNLVKSAIDPAMFMLDGAMVILGFAKDVMGKNGSLSQAMEMSASFRSRVKEGMSGDVVGLESGTTTFKPRSKNHTRLGRASSAFKTAAASPTIIGDVLGVMGYMINYNRNIRNGMQKEKAVEVFNNYNATQQTRRGSEKNLLQSNRHFLVRAFTMFGSVIFLQMNKVMSSSTNIMRATTSGKMPSKKDMRDFYLNAATANVLFAVASNIAMLIKGNSDDKDEALKRIAEAMAGMNLLYQLPFMGEEMYKADLIGRAIAEAGSKKYKQPFARKFGGSAINPISSVFSKIGKSIDKNGAVLGTVQGLVEITIGAQVDPFIGLVNMFSSDSEKDSEEALYDIMGISPYYRPKNEKGTFKQPKGMTKSELKKAMPELYKDIYGDSDEVLEEIRDIRSESLKGTEMDDLELE